MKDINIHEWQAKYLREEYMVKDPVEIAATLKDDGKGGTVTTVGAILNKAIFLTRNNSYDVDTVLEVAAELCNIKLEGKIK